MHPKPVHKPTYHAPKPSYRPPPRGRPRPRPSLFKLPKLPGIGLPSLGGPGGLLRPAGPPKGHKGHGPAVDYGGWKPIGSYKVHIFELMEFHVISPCLNWYFCLLMKVEGSVYGGPPTPIVTVEDAHHHAPHVDSYSPPPVPHGDGYSAPVSSHLLYKSMIPSPCLKHALG